ncbi:MAG: OmpH family outer membrane protein [Rikenellaceae bacterium]
MKNLLKIALFVALTLSTTLVSAQKSGRINIQTIIVAMPETAKMQADLEAIRKDFSENLETMQVELNNKINDYQQNEATMTASIRSLKEKDMQDLNTRMQQFEQSATQEMQAKQNEMLSPIIAKAREAVDAEAKAGGFAMIFDESAGALAYYDETLVPDITPNVMKRMGLR